MAACTEAVKWAESFDSLEAAWSECPRGDWMVWLRCKHASVNLPDNRRVVVGILLRALKSTPIIVNKASKYQTLVSAGIELLTQFVSGVNVPPGKLRQLKSQLEDVPIQSCQAVWNLWLIVMAASEDNIRIVATAALDQAARMHIGSDIDPVQAQMTFATWVREVLPNTSFTQS